MSGREKRKSQRPKPPLRTNVAGLAKNVEKQLLSDILAWGGIGTNGEIAFTVKKICDYRPYLYGKPADPLRRKIGDRVRRYRSLSPEEFTALCFRFGATEALGERAGDVPTEVELTQEETEAESSYDFVTEDEEEYTTFSSQSDEASYRTTRLSLSKMSTKGFEIKAADPRVKPIKVDVENPEMNHPFKVTSVPDVYRGGIYHDYHEVEMHCVDPRDWLQDKYKCFLLEEGANKVLIEIPSLPASQMNDDDVAAIEKGEKFFDTHCQKGSHFAGILRSDILDDPDRQTIKYLLTFPSGTALSSKEYPSESDPKMPRCDLVNYDVDIALDPSSHDPRLNYTTKMHFVRWRISLVEEKVRRVTSTKPANQTEAAARIKRLSQGVSNMNVGP